MKRKTKCKADRTAKSPISLAFGFTLDCEQSLSLPKGAVTLGNFPCNLSRNLFVPLRHKLHESLPSVTCPEMNIMMSRSQSPLHEVEPTSTSRNGCGNKKIARRVHFRACYTRQRFVQRVSQQNCERNCKKHFPV